MFRLSDFCSVLQAEIAAIKEAVDLLLKSVTSVREVRIHWDSQAAIRALNAIVVRSKLVGECLTPLSTASRYFLIRFNLVPPGHSGIAGISCLRL